MTKTWSGYFLKHGVDHHLFQQFQIQIHPQWTSDSTPEDRKIGDRHLLRQLHWDHVTQTHSVDIRLCPFSPPLLPPPVLPLLRCHTADNIRSSFSPASPSTLCDPTVRQTYTQWTSDFTPLPRDRVSMEGNATGSVCLLTLYLLNWLTFDLDLWVYGSRPLTIGCLRLKVKVKGQNAVAPLQWRRTSSLRSRSMKLSSVFSYPSISNRRVPILSRSSTEQTFNALHTTWTCYCYLEPLLHTNTTARHLTG